MSHSTSLLGRVAARQPRHEARAVEIRVDLQLEVDLRALGHQAERVVETGVVPDHRSKHHLVVPALRAARGRRPSTCRGRRRSLVVPPRRGHPRRGQVEVGDGLGLIGDRRHLAEEQPAEEPIPARGLVHRGHVHELVVHDGRHPLVGGQRLEGETQRCDLHGERVARHRACRSVPCVREVEQEDRHFPVGIEPKELLLERQRGEECPGGVRRQVGFAPLEVDQPQVAHLDLGQLGRRRHGRQQEEREQRGSSSAARAATGCGCVAEGRWAHPNLWRAGSC